MPRPVREKIRLLVGLLALLAGGCSFADAQVGARQDTCDLNGGHAQTPPRASGYYRSDPVDPSAPPVCEGNTGRACDDCESAHCCARLSACYGDPVCACADLALDQCLDQAKAAPVAEVAARASECWNTFSAAGIVEEARVACRRAWCEPECALDLSAQ